MRCKPFESAAAELVDESLHPLEQLEILSEKAKQLKNEGDADAVIECRIKQLTLQRVLAHLHQFPLQPLIQAQAALAEAYGQGGYFLQAREHLAQAREVCNGGIYDDPQHLRLQADLLVAEGSVQLAQGQLEAAGKTLMEAARLGRETRGELDEEAAHVHLLLGQVASQKGDFEKAIDHLSEAWEVHDHVDGKAAEPTLRIRMQVAEAERAANRLEAAVETVQAVVSILQHEEPQKTALLMKCSCQVAGWLEADKREAEALEALQVAESAAEHLGEEDPQVVDVKRDMALLYIKLGRHEDALQYLNDVHYLERRLHGSQSSQVARTLKALGSVHLVLGKNEEAESCLRQALRIFEIDSHNAAIVRDIHAKLASIPAGDV